MMADRNAAPLRLGNDLRDNAGRPVTVGQVQAVDGQRRVFQCLQRGLAAIKCQAPAGMPRCIGLFRHVHPNGEFIMLPLTLYTTSGCHLCEHAEAILEQGGHVFQAVDIADDLSLMELYGVRIPVVKDASGRELGWPFDGTQLDAFMRGE